MADRTRIFVSHSSQDNDLTSQVCQLLVSGQLHERYEVLVDTDKLEDADPWPQQLHEMMADCHAAVVLLSANAVASAWVLKELTILSWRKSLETDFKLFIAQFPHVTDAQLTAARYDPLQHRLIQNIASSDPKEIAERVRARLDADAVVPTVTLFDRIAKALALVIEDTKEEALAEIAQKLRVAAPRWRPGGRPNRARVEAMAVALLHGRLGAYADLRELVNDLKTARLSRDGLQDLMRLLASHWVQAQAAGQLAGLVGNDKGVIRCRAAAINGRHARRYTGLMYVQRAFPFSREFRVLGATPPLPGNPIEHYTKCIHDYCGKFKRYEDMSVEELIEEMKLGEPWLFVVIACIDSKALAELQDRFPLVRFLIHVAGAQLDHTTVPAGAVCLLPAVDAALEEQQLNGYSLAQNVITSNE